MYIIKPIKKFGKKLIIFREGWEGRGGTPVAENSAKIINSIFEPFPYSFSKYCDFKIRYGLAGSETLKAVWRWQQCGVVGGVALQVVRHCRQCNVAGGVALQEVWRSQGYGLAGGVALQTVSVAGSAALQAI